MPPSLNPRLVNGPFDDPGLFIPFFFQNHAVIFDLGEIYSLAPRDILKISHIFITHTHIDHFVGFDRLLRLVLGREKTIYLYGPEGFFKNVEGKLAGYSWNLVNNYSNRLILNVTEVYPDYVMTKEYLIQDRFLPRKQAVKNPFTGMLLEDPLASVSAVILDHSIPCLGFTIKEQFHINIKKDALDALGLETGPWLNEFKQALLKGKPADAEFKVTFKEKAEKRFILGDLAEKIAFISPGQKITYIADVIYTETNVRKIIEFAKDSDHLFIEAAFLEKHKKIAREKCHLTAWQAGALAAWANAKRFTIFHFSPRYTGQEHLMQKEATEAYHSTKRNSK